MRILVTIKRVSDPAAKVKISADGREIDNSNADFKVNPFDEYALEEALRLRDKGAGRVTEVAVLSVGSSAVTKELRSALAMGADRAVLVDCDDKNLDPSSVSALLAAAIKVEQPDMVIMGKLAVDGENNQVAQRVAQRLGWAQAIAALRLELGAETVKATCQADGGLKTVECRLPVVVSRADMRDEDVRTATLPNIMKAKSKPFKTLTPAELGVTPKPLVKTLGYELPPQRQAGRVVASVDELIDKLKNEAKVV